MSKEKYQEALDYIEGVVPLLKGKIIAYVEKIGLPNSIKILQELVNIYPEYLELKAKATPKKPTFVESYPSGECPNCGESIGGRNYCSYCGQAIDWSK